MKTEEQKCEYCNAVDHHFGKTILEGEDDKGVYISIYPNGKRALCCNIGGILHKTINFCPMCGKQFENV